MPPPTGPGGKSTARKPLRGRSKLFHYHSILLSRSFPGKLGTSLQTDSLVALAQLPKFCLPTTHLRRGHTRSRSCIDAGTSLLRRHRPLLAFVTHRGFKCTMDLWQPTTGSPRSLAPLIPVRLFSLWSPHPGTLHRMEPSPATSPPWPPCPSP